MSETVRTTADKIRTLEVQGARNVAIAAIKALQTLAEQTKAKNKTAFTRRTKGSSRFAFCFKGNGTIDEKCCTLDNYSSPRKQHRKG